MDRDRALRAVEMLDVLRQDIKDDVERRDGEAFTGRNIAAALGEICAQIHAIAGVVKEVVRDQYELEEGGK